MSIQCVFCHRIDLGNRWVYENPQGTVTYVACPMCIEHERKKGGLTEAEKIQEAFNRGESMNKDEAFLRMKTREWERRFIDGGTCSVEVMIRIVDNFLRIYGLAEYERIHKQVVSETAREIMREIS